MDQLRNIAAKADRPLRGGIPPRIVFSRNAIFQDNRSLYVPFLLSIGRYTDGQLLSFRQAIDQRVQIEPFRSGFDWFDVTKKVPAG
ncbi:hypothetical protein [Allosphingosinicella humi]